MDPKHAKRLNRYNKPVLTLGVIQSVIAFSCLVIQICGLPVKLKKHEKYGETLTFSPGPVFAVSGFVMAIFGVAAGLLAIFGALKRIRGLYIAAMVTSIISTNVASGVIFSEVILLSRSMNFRDDQNLFALLSLRVAVLILLMMTEGVICITQAAFLCCIGCPKCCYESLRPRAEDHTELNLVSQRRILTIT